MQSFGKSSSWHRTTGMFVDDEHLVILHDIFLIFFIHRLCTKRIFDMMDLFVSDIFVKILYLRIPSNFVMPLQLNAAVLVFSSI